MLVEIDYREHGLIACIGTPEGLSVEVKPLDVGDIVIQRDCGETVIIERKTLADLRSSLVDGRWSEQKSRLKGLEGCTVHFLIEGTDWMSDERVRCAILSLLSSTWARGGLAPGGT